MEVLFKLNSALLILMLFLVGCGNQKNEGYLRKEEPLEKNEIEGVMEIFRSKSKELYESGVHFTMASERDSVLNITVFDADQRAINKINEIMGGDVEVVVWDSEGLEELFVRGEITEKKNSDDEARRLGRILVEGSEEDTRTDKAYISVIQPTKIISYMQQPGYLEKKGRRALTFDDLEVGQTVEVWVMGIIRDSYPPSAPAKEILIMD